MVSPAQDFPLDASPSSSSRNEGGQMGSSEPEPQRRTQGGEATAEASSRSATPLAKTPGLIRLLETRLDLLRARGLAVPDVYFDQPYAELVTRKALAPLGSGKGSPAATPHSGWDVRDDSGVRYRVVSCRKDGDVEVSVPGIPDLAFDRIVLVTLDADYRIVSVVDAPVRPFLRAARYDEDENRWSLETDDAFWDGRRAGDLTLVFRAAVEELDEEDAPHLGPFRGPPGYWRRAGVREKEDLSPLRGVRPRASGAGIPGPGPLCHPPGLPEGRGEG